MNQCRCLGLMLVVSCLSACAGTGKESEGVQLGWSGTAKAVLGVLMGERIPGGADKGCQVMPQGAVDDNATKVCSEQQLKDLESYVGVYKGTLSGSDKGTVALQIDERKGVNGVVNRANHGIFNIKGYFVLSGDTLIIRANSLKSVSVNGSITKEGTLTGVWKDNTQRTNGLFNARLTP